MAVGERQVKNNVYKEKNAGAEKKKEKKKKEEEPKYIKLSILLSGLEHVLSCHKLRSSIEPVTSGNTLLRLAKLR